MTFSDNLFYDLIKTNFIIESFKTLDINIILILY